MIKRSDRTVFEQLSLVCMLNLVTSIGAIFASSSIQAHGYVSMPESRSLLCKKGLNRKSDCGAVIYEPQSVEGPDRYPESGPGDGELASGGNAAFQKLNGTGKDRWAKSQIAKQVNDKGQLEIRWHLTAPHRTKDFRYFITKPDWNPELPLTRAQFEAVPFCLKSLNGEVPNRDITHQCRLPKRNGYHVVLAVWDVADTVNSFYNVIDLNFSESTSVLDVLTDIPDDKMLKQNSSIHLTLNDASGERSDLKFTYSIQSKQDGQANRWPKLFSEAMNRALSGIVKAGVYDGNHIEPANKSNKIYAVDTNILSARLTFSDGDKTDYDPYAVYTKGDVVLYKGKQYRAKWWTQGQVPGDDYWGPWEAFSTDLNEVRQYRSNKVYVAGDRVEYQGVLYIAKWWNMNQTPGVDPWGPWKLSRHHSH